MILGIEGSPRKGGNSRTILETVLAGAAKTGRATEAVHLRDLQFGSCIGCEKCRKDHICTGQDDGMTALYPRILESHGLVLVSPVHNYNVTAWMKAFIDRLYCFYDFDDERPRGWSSRLAGQGRKAVIAAVGEQVHKADMGFTLAAMRMPLEALGYEVVEQVAVFGMFDRGVVANHPDVLAKAERAGHALARAMAD